MNVYFRLQRHYFGMVGKQWFKNVRLISIVELRSWSGYGAVFTRFGKYRVFYNTSLLTVNLFRHSTLIELGLYTPIFSYY